MKISLKACTGSSRDAFFSDFKEATISQKQLIGRHIAGKLDKQKAGADFSGALLIFRGVGSYVELQTIRRGSSVRGVAAPVMLALSFLEFAHSLISKKVSTRGGVSIKRNKKC